MPKLHELLAVESDLENVTKKTLEEAKSTFTKKAAHFMEMHRKLENFDAEEKETPEEHQEMVTTVRKKLTYIQGHVARYWDAVYMKESTNQAARANVIVDGVVLLEDIPATFLLGLETKLKKLRELYDTIPTLPPGTAWEKDTSKGPDIYKAVYAEKKFKTAKTFKHKVLYEATEQHPAQIERWEETQNVGLYVLDRWCGMPSSAEKSKMLERIDTLLRAVKKARQRANTQKVETRTVADRLFAYLNG